MQVGIVAQRGNERALALAERLAETLRADGVTVRLDETTAERLGDSWAAGSLAACELVVSIGGDGTFLFAARQAGATPVLGVNLGEVGFLNAVSPTDAVDVVGQEVERIRETGQPRVREVGRLRATGTGWDLPLALNEVVVQGPQRGHGNGADLVVRVDGAEYLTGHADGVLVATPTGSTAYNLSEGGPLVHPSVGSLVVTEMCATDSMPPLVVDDDSTVSVEVAGAEEAFVISDGRAQQSVEPPTTVEVSVADDPLRIAGPPVDFFEALGKLD